jgi:thiosulfate/3-mercaptopyruvate sulfurtransferase
MSRKTLLAVVSLLGFALLSVSRATTQDTSSGADKDLQTGSPVLLQPVELVKLLKSAGKKPLVFFVGPRAFYVQSHVPGAEFLGPTGRPEGLEKLRSRAASLPKSTPIVIYCGCCPWIHCPNIHPAYSELKKMGFTRLRVLVLETSFGVDWTEKGYPVEKGS